METSVNLLSLLERQEDDETMDRLSLLPESLIFEILSFLETREVVRTSLLSKRWKDLWTTIPYFNFNDSGEDINPLTYINFINWVLQRWNGTKIFRFKMALKKYYKEVSLSDESACWVEFATEGKVEDLDLELMNQNLDFKIELIFSCSSIKKLRLIVFSIEKPERGNINVQWSRLQSLEMADKYFGISDDLLLNIVSNSPQLQVLHIVQYIMFGPSCCIQSSSLKSLTLNATFGRCDEPSIFTLSAPNLERLTMSIMPWMKDLHLSFDVPALTDVILNKLDLHHLELENINSEAIEQVFLGIQHVEVLTIQLLDYEKLGVMKGKCLFSNVKILKLNGGPIRPDIVLLADFFPNVEKLIIDWTRFWGNEFGKINYSDSEANLLLQLKTVEIIWSLSHHPAHFIKFIKFFVKGAIILQKIVIRRVASCVRETLGSFAKTTPQLLSLQSSFPTLDIFILCDTKIKSQPLQRFNFF